MDFDIEIFAGIHFTPWRILWLAALPFQLLTIMFLFILPESPKFYLSIQENEKAKQVLEQMSKQNKGKTLADLGITSIPQMEVVKVDPEQQYVIPISRSIFC